MQLSRAQTFDVYSGLPSILHVSLEQTTTQLSASPVQTGASS